MIKPVLKGLRFVITVPLYEQKVLFIFGNTPEQAYNIAINQGCGKEAAGWLAEGGFAGLSVRCTESGWYILYTPELPLTAEQYGTVSHECFHITEYIMEKVGIKYSPHNSSEAFAYVLGFLTANVFDSLMQAATYRCENEKVI